MGSKIIIYAIPFFVLFILLEYWWAPKNYQWKDALANMATGALSEALGWALPIGLFGVYVFLQRTYGVFQWSETAWITWVVAFIGSDFLYYWWHRLSHEVNFLWAAHIVHHQSEAYNLSVALRQSWITTFTAAFFYMPLAFLGIPFQVFIAMKSFMILYQFWIHTETIRKLGVFEGMMNTPSHHRVHHGINPQYLDKNYAGTFIVWDRIFGSFEPEVEPVRYGIVKPIGSLNPFWANVHFWMEMWNEARKRSGLFKKFKVLLDRPENLHSENS